MQQALMWPGSALKSLWYFTLIPRRWHGEIQLLKNALPSVCVCPLKVRPYVFVPQIIIWCCLMYSIKRKRIKCSCLCGKPLAVPVNHSLYGRRSEELLLSSSNSSFCICAWCLDVCFVLYLKIQGVSLIINRLVIDSAPYYSLKIWFLKGILL